MLETYRFVKENPLNTAQLNVMIPYPGTDIWGYAKSRNLVSEDMDWDSFDMDFEQNNDKYIVIDDAVSRQELNRMYFKIKNAMQKKLPFLRRSSNLVMEAFHAGILPSATKTIHSLNAPDSLLASGYRILKKVGLARLV